GIGWARSARKRAPRPTIMTSSIALAATAMNLPMAPNGDHGERIQSMKSAGRPEANPNGRAAALVVGGVRSGGSHRLPGSNTWRGFIQEEPIGAEITDGFDEFFEVNRLADVAVGPEPVTFDDVFFFGRRGQDNHGQEGG